MSSVIEQLGRAGLVPVIKLDRPEDAVPLAQALERGGLPCAEITFRTAAAEAAIRHIAAAAPHIALGAGTVLSVNQARRAVDAGAKYIVSPGLDADVASWCRDHAVPLLPGVATPTEIMTALKLGLSLLKFFPAEQIGGVSMLKALAGPFPEVKFIPTGGVNASNLGDYLRLPNVYACGGSWMVAGNLVSQGLFDEITRLAREARDIVDGVRGDEAQR